MVTPTGKLIPIGGSENKDCREKGDCSISFYNSGILKRIYDEMKGKNPRLEIVPTASGIPGIVSQRYIKAFNKLGCSDIGVIPVESRQDALNTEYVDRIKKADGIFFTGGDQSRLTRFFGNTPFINTVYQRYLDDDFVVAGTSAGAMAMSLAMITGNSVNSLMKEGVEMATGLSFIDNVIIDTHFIERDRYNRLGQAIEANPGYIGMGLGEDTGLVLKNGTDIEVIGSGQVVIMNNNALGHTSIFQDSIKPVSSISNMIIHHLAIEDLWDLNEPVHSQYQDLMIS
ncbi:MAG: cyanophycinase [Balneolales bacterium]